MPVNRWPDDGKDPAGNSSGVSLYQY